MSQPVDHLRSFLRSAGFEGDPEMATTAERVTAFLAEFVPADDPPDIGLCEARGVKGPVAVRHIPFHSLCAHHLLPFFGHVSVAYRPHRTLAGLGGIPRLVRHVARRPQLQERMMEQLADALVDGLSPRGLVVVSTARHLCVEMRGASVPAEVRVVTSRGDADDRLWAQVEAP